MGQALYRKHRPKSLSEVVGQEHITTTLDNSLKKGALSHAYLFTGPRGVGKTSIARILAHEANQLPYDESVTHLDIIEIDAASNRGIEEIRSLREKVHTAPTSGTYKVYIIDEVHMLTTPAFNALLKTLEEPPAHVIFVLATTESHKLPATIVSRTQRFTFKPIEEAKVVAHLRDIAKQEKIAVSDEALGLIARHGEGSFRDSISLLDQASSNSDKIELDDVLAMLGIAPVTAITQLLDTTLHDSAQALLEQLSTIRERGFHAGGVAKQLGAEIRQRLLGNQLSISPLAATGLLRQLLAVPAAHDPDALLEIILLDTNLEIRGHENPPVPPTASSVTPAPPSKSTPKPNPAAEKPTVPATKTTATESRGNTENNNSNATAMDIWPQVLDTVKKRQNTLYGILRMAKPIMDGDTLTLTFNHSFHQKKINETKTKAILSDIIAHLSGQPVIVTCQVQSPGKSPNSVKTPPSEHLDTISSIFGGAEVLE